MTEVPIVQSSEMIHEGYFNVRTDLLQRDGNTLHYTVVQTGCDAAVILAQDEKKRLIINSEYRHPVGKYILSSPGGRVEKGEDPEVCAKRELLEETGYEIEKLQLIGSSYPLPAICDQKIYYFFCDHARKVQEPKRDPFEYMKTILIPEEELLKLISEGAEIDGVLCTALHFKRLIIK